MSDTIIETGETERSETREERMAETAEKLVHGLFGVGKLWAAHGLNVGRSALETTATTLRTTAALLGDISQRFEPSEAAASEAATSEPTKSEDRKAEDRNAA